MWFLNRSDTIKHRRWLEAENYGLTKLRNCTICVAKCCFFHDGADIKNNQYFISDLSIHVISYSKTVMRPKSHVSFNP